jgi:hypothetical protein
MSEPSEHAKLAASQAWFARVAGVLFGAPRVPGAALLVSRAGAASRVIIEQFDAGRDAQYFTISRNPKRMSRFPPDDVPPRETIGFLPQVAGTDILYDLSDTALQGKCRPFLCDLTKVWSRIYTLTPMQIESIAISSAKSPAGRAARVEFHDGRGQRLQAIFPFHYWIEAHGSVLVGGHDTTAADGRFDFPAKILADLPAASRLTIHSQLTGREQSIEL